MTFEGLVLVLLNISFFPFAYVVFRKTPLELSWKKKKLWSLWLYYEFVLILLPILLVYFTKIENVKIFNLAKSGIELKIGFLVLFTMYAFVITASIVLRYLFQRGQTITDDLQTIVNTKQLNRFACAALLTTSLAFAYATFFGGYKHALIYSLLYEENLLQVRLYNSYFTQITSHFKVLFFLSSWIFAIQAGVQVSKGQHFKAAIYFFSSIFFASAPGDKAPIIHSVLNFIMASIMSCKRALNLRKSMWFFGVIVVSGMALSYGLFALQIRNSTPDTILEQIKNRLGIGQMAGVYETFSLDYIPRGAYYWSMIPMSSFFADYRDYHVDFHKVLMMITEGFDYTDMGVKNTLFIAEAYAIGGTWLLYLSPLIVGMSFSLGMWITFKLLKAMFGNEVASTYFIPFYLSGHKLTGGFAIFPLLKGVIADFLLMTPCWFVYLLLQGVTATKKYKNCRQQKTVNQKCPFAQM